MANNPVQIVLNDGDYVVKPEGKKGGPPFDFFAGKDAEFAKHKATIATGIQKAAAQLDAKHTGGLGYIRVRLRERALAKLIGRFVLFSLQIAFRASAPRASVNSSISRDRMLFQT